MDTNHYWGKDCPVGMVQVEFVGCDPKTKKGQYGWKPCESTFLEIYIDGQRYSIQVGNFHDGVAQRRGLHIVGPFDFQCEKTSLNAASVFVRQEKP